MNRAPTMPTPHAAARSRAGMASMPRFAGLFVCAFVRPFVRPFMRPFTRALAAVMFALLVLPCAHAASAPEPEPEDVPPSTVERDVHLFVVQKDGSVEEHDDTVLRANTNAGVDEIAQRYVWFNKDTERVALLAAETIEPDGTVRRVEPEGIRDVQEPRSSGAPTFEDGVLRTVIFPGVQPGARVHLAFRKTRVAPRTGATFAYFVEPTGGPVEFQQLIYDLPEDVPLYADARGYVALAPVTANGRTRYTFEYRHGPYAPQEAGAAGYVTWGDRLMVSTVRDYAAFAALYRDAAADPTATDPQVPALAAALTAHAATPREKARAIYDWVRFNIRYVALFLGETATVPHRVTDVLRNRYGDCKDHVAVFTALLAAAGIRAEAALIGLGAVYTLPSVPGYGSGAINHVIVWMPDLQLFADTTAGGTAFGYLPGIVMDRPALLVDEGVLTRTPATQPRARSVHLSVDVGADGNAAYAYHVDDDGVSAELERNLFRRATRQRAQQVAADRLRQTGFTGTAKIRTAPLAPTEGPFSTTTTGTIEHAVWPDGATAMPALSSLAGGIASQVQAWLAVPRRTQPFVCIDGDFDETAQISLPRTVHVEDLPTDTEEHDGFVDYASHYVFDAASQTLQIERRLHTHFGRQLCTPETFDAMRAALVAIERDALSQIVVRAKPGGPAHAPH